MAKERLSLEVVEEGRNPEVTTEGLGCCWTLFMFYYTNV